MKNLSKIVAAAGVSTAMAAISLAPVVASSPGQLLGGDLMQVKNLTQGGSYAKSTTAKTCEEVQYSIMLSNTEYGQLNDIMVKVAMPTSGSSIVSTMTALPASNAAAGATDTATVNLSAQNINYESGSTVLYNEQGQKIKDLPDGITAGGVNIGNLKGSTIEFVNFKAKTNCPTPEQPGKGAPVTSLPETGPEAALGLTAVAGTGALGYAVAAYRRSQKAVADALRK